MQKSLFTPAVTVSDDGTIEIDWADSYQNTFDDDAENYAETFVEPSKKHSDLLDRIVVEGTEAQKLRRLADYIELHAPVQTASTKGTPA